ncbi:unnamed protein product [Gongylonema pulchrum]|uniref:Uncharacterized protein n=1 Tax=Gongylonema pulchrum TaxID=637853 RepID=A0A183ETF9_9BILA|nr:unnamed protein product [Gongylonema pulchrum]
MRAFRLPLRFFLKRAGTVITKYSRPALRSEVLGRGLTLWGRVVIRPLALATYQKQWKRENVLGVNRRNFSLLRVCTSREVPERIKVFFFEKFLRF